MIWNVTREETESSRDAVQKLSIEYARLVRENERLRSVMQSAVNVLADSTSKEFKKGLVLLLRFNEPSMYEKVPC